MLITAELRWFKPGLLPPEILSWFKQDCFGKDLSPPETREDLYLYLANCDYLGIKLRQERLEIKWRQAELGSIGFGKGITGKVEKWSKWLCEDPTKQSFQPALIKGERIWLSVNKHRFQRHYQTFPDNSQVVPVNQSVNQGCSLELTQLSIKDDAWWSLAFESFGKDDCLLKQLQTVAAQVFKTYPGEQLTTIDSYAYPKWLYTRRGEG